MSIIILREYYNQVKAGAKPLGVCKVTHKYEQEQRHHFDMLPQDHKALLFRIKGDNNTTYGYARNETIREAFITLLKYRDKGIWPKRELDNGFTDKQSEIIISTFEGLLFGYSSDDIHQFIKKNHCI